MDALYYLERINKEKTLALQRFLDLALIDNWQSDLYEILKEKYEKGKLKGICKNAYDDMCLNGIENYCTKRMDITFALEVIKMKNKGGGYLVPLNKNTFKSLQFLINDRNKKSHFSYNENQEEYYYQILLNISDIQQFIKNVHHNETRISESKRLEYTQKYGQQFKQLHDEVITELLDFLNCKKIDESIEKIKSSKEPQKVFSAAMVYFSRQLPWEKGKELPGERFHIKASDAGIVEAHSFAALIDCDYHRFDKAIERMERIYIANNVLHFHECQQIINIINLYKKSAGKEPTERMKKMISIITKQGYMVYENDKGNYILNYN